MRRTSIAIFIMLACVLLLSSQSIVEIAKKEKERRAALKAKGKISMVLTNADLKKKDKLPAISVRSQVPTSRERSQPRQRSALRLSNQTTTQQKASNEKWNLDVYGYRKNATKIGNTMLTENPEFALDRPDGNYAQISFGGFLDLEFQAKNGPGEDIAIYMRRSGTEGGAALEDGIPAGIEGRAFPGTLQYGVLVMGKNGDWEAIGQGRGIKSPKRFDLGNNTNISRIRIIYRPFGNVTADRRDVSVALKPNVTSMDIDAVEALH
jgi:hypothetical protein